MNSLAKIKIYLVDPDSAVRDSIKVLLQSFGAEVLTFHTGQSFLHNAKNQLHECVFIENSLPDMTGIQLLERLKKSNIKGKYILLNSANDNGIDQLAHEQNAYAVLRKPLQSESLLKIIKS